MGAWGEGLLDNDTALDVAADWDQFVTPLIKLANWDGAQIWKFMERCYFRQGINCQDSNDNLQLLAVGALYQKHDLALPPDLKALLERAVSIELTADFISEWRDKKARKKVLLAFLESIGGKRVKVSSIDSENLDIVAEIEALKPFTDHLDRWAKVVSPPHSDDDFERLYPPFLDAIERLLIQGIKPQMLKSDQEHELIKLRFMIMAFYVAWKAERSSEEIATIVRHAKATEGAFFMALDIGGSGA